MNPKIVADLNELRNRVSAEVNKARRENKEAHPRLDQHDVDTLTSTLALVDFIQSVLENRR